MEYCMKQISFAWFWPSARVSDLNFSVGLNIWSSFDRNIFFRINLNILLVYWNFKCIQASKCYEFIKILLKLIFTFVYLVFISFPLFFLFLNCSFFIFNGFNILAKLIKYSQFGIKEVLSVRKANVGVKIRIDNNNNIETRYCTTCLWKK